MDYETTGLEYFRDLEEPLILGISFQPGGAWIIPLAHRDSCFKHNWQKVLKYFADKVISNPNVVKVAQNFKFEDKWCKRYGITIAGRMFDTMLAKYLLDEEKPHDLKSIVTMLYPQYAHYEDIIKPGKGMPAAWRDKPFKPLCKYCGMDTDLELRIMVYLEGQLMKKGFYNLFRNLLMMASRVLAWSEYEGVLIDRPYLEGLVGKYRTLIKVAEEKMLGNKRILKFDQQRKKDHIAKLIKQCRLEIAQIEEEDRPNAERLIAARQTKINNYLKGKLTTKKETFNSFNPASPAQLVELFFRSPAGFRWKPVKMTDPNKKKKTPNKSGKVSVPQPSTDEEVLLVLQKRDKSGFITALLEHRGLCKLNSTYIEGVLPLLDKNDRLHASFKLHGTVTGRLSCAEPNLQNIPRGLTAIDIKKMYIAPKGYVVIEVDYGQAELRVVAEEAGDVAMIDIFKRGYNVHVATACKVNGCLERYDEIKRLLKDDMKDHPEHEFWQRQKKRAKTLNFGILYEQGDEKLAEALGCTPEEAAKFKEEWFRAFPQIKKWIKNQHRKVREQGYVESLWGRKRRLYDIYSEHKFRRAEAERQSVNAPIQSAASDFTLFSSIIIWEKIQSGEFPKDMQQTWTVHDSIGYYIKPEDVHWVLPRIVKICADPQTQEYFGFKMKNVSMKVSPEVGMNWADLEDWDPNTDYLKKYNEIWSQLN